MKGELFLNGLPPRRGILKKLLNDGAYKVCADGALRYIKEFFLPDAIVADFDSLAEKEAAGIKRVFKHETEKDFTDGHLALETLAAAGCDEIDIYGGEGGDRIDHQLANYSLLKLACGLGCPARMMCRAMTVYYREDTFRFAAAFGETVSIVPLGGDAHIIYTKGLKYPMRGVTLTTTHILGISNVALADEIEVGLDAGGVLVFLQNRVGGRL